MRDVSVALHPASDDEMRYVERLLSRNELPTSDLRTGAAEFHIATRDGKRVAVCGLERYGEHGLVRSLAVEESVRGEGVGTAVCAALEDDARAAGVETLWLLTTTAAEFFADRGYRECPRSDAPSAIRQTTEFDSLCPDSAVCMRLSLSDRR